MSSYWANFAKTGDPNGKGLPQWAAVNDRPNTTMQIGDEVKMIPIAATPDRVEFWHRYFVKLNRVRRSLRWRGPAGEDS